MTAATEEDFLVAGEEKETSIGSTLQDVAVVSIINIPLQAIATDLGLLNIAAGLLALYALCVVGVLLTRFVPLRLPSVAWISLVGIVATLPMLPWGPWFLSLVEGLDFLAMAIPALAYAGLAVSKLEMGIMRRSGWKLFIVAVLVFIGTYLGSVVIAELMLGLT
jgi:hypothetical protein